jgi:RHS repeat-associated protein
MKVATLPQSITQRYAYDENNRLVGEYTGATKRDTIWMNEVPVAVVDVSGTTSTESYIHADALGTPRAVSNSGGTTIWTWAYKGNPFGESLPASTGGFTLNLRFAGQYADAEAGKFYNQFRDYDQATGRYLQSDPLGLRAGFSTYSYVANGPLGLVDPLGLDPAHRYDVTDQICSTIQSGCTMGAVFDRLLRYPSPFSDSGHTTEDNDEVNIPGLGPTLHTVDADDYSVQNITLPDQLLYPGQVTRSVISDDGQIYIHTVGTGTGSFGLLNEILAPPVWGWVDGNIAAPWYPTVGGSEFAPGVQ